MDHEDIFKRFKLIIPIINDEILDWRPFNEKAIKIIFNSGYSFIFELESKNNINTWHIYEELRRSEVNEFINDCKKIHIR